jgi:metal-responsive CopG/Arc/MetJ family transcriptional regulator
MTETLLRLVEKYRKEHLRTSRSDAIKFLLQDYGNKLTRIEKLEARVRELEGELERLRRGRATP